MFSILLEKMLSGRPLSPAEKQQLILQARRIEQGEMLLTSLLQTGTQNMRLNSVTISNGDVVLDPGGIFIKNNQEAGLTFGNVDNERGTDLSIYSSLSNSLGISNLSAANNGGINLTIRLSDATQPYVQFVEDGTQAGRSWLEVKGGEEGTRLTIDDGNAAAAIDLRAEGQTGGSTFIRMTETSNTPPAPSGDAVHVYMKGDKLIIQAGSGTYFYLDLTATTDQSWTYSATAP